MWKGGSLRLDITGKIQIEEEEGENESAALTGIRRDLSSSS